MKQFATGIVVSLLLAVAGALAADGEPPGVALPPIETAGSDDRGRIVVNGKPFFPILMYDVPTDAESLKKFHEHGFNVLSARVEDAETLRQHGFYAAAHGTGPAGDKLHGVLFGIGMDSPALNWKDDLLEKSAADLLNMRQAFPGRPIFHAIGYWENEPPGVFSNQIPSKERYEELVKVLDVSAPYLYPLPYQPVRSVGVAVARANTASQGRKPLLPVLQLFVWKPEDRYPTPAELKCMAYLSLIHGADGIGYYSYNHVTGKEQTNIAREQPELWSSVQEVNLEVKQLGEFLLDSSPQTKVRVESPESTVEWRAAARGDLSVLLLANTSAASQSVQVQGISEKTFLRWGDHGVKLTVKNGVVKFSLGPHEALGLFGEK